jgi:hypothetical protein
MMNATGQAGVAVSTDIGATLPDLAWYATALFIGAGLLAAAATVLIAVPVRRSARSAAA